MIDIVVSWRTPWITAPNQRGAMSDPIWPSDAQMARALPYSEKPRTRAQELSMLRKDMRIAPKLLLNGLHSGYSLDPIERNRAPRRGID